MEAFARIATECLAGHQLRVAVVIAPRRIEIIDAVLVGVIEHFQCRRLVNVRIIAVHDRKAHRAHAELRNLFSLKICINHAVPPFFLM